MLWSANIYQSGYFICQRTRQARKAEMTQPSHLSKSQKCVQKSITNKEKIYD